MWSFTKIYLVPLTVVVGYMIGGLWTFLTPFSVFVVMPFFDLITGQDMTNAPESYEKILESQISYRIITWICAPLQIITVCWGLFMSTYGKISVLEFMGIAVSVGVCSGVMGINVSHELAHRVNGKLEPFLSRFMLWSVLYMHWGLEHVVGHHRHVATPEDPATAKLGQSFYAFWPQTVFGSFNSAWEFEANRLQKKNLHGWSLKNKMVVFILLQFILVLAVTLLFGGKGLIFLIIQSLVAISLLEIVNYIEHYGLLRKMENGQYEKVKPWHSWNSSNRLTNQFLFNLQRHSDHHYKPGRRYQILRHFDESPQLPTGYAGMILLAAIPPLWRSIMDPKIKAIRERENRPVKYSN
ncbi:MAG: alkane 1-monooxygenase [Proteobacteria bacterium]|nr:alkane 1-monooxygenase [Pseudomonadota bacterium]